MKAQSLGFRVEGAGFGVSGFGFWVSGVALSGFLHGVARIVEGRLLEGLFHACGLGFRVSGYGSSSGVYPNPEAQRHVNVTVSAHLHSNVDGVVPRIPNVKLPIVSQACRMIPFPVPSVILSQI